MRLVTQGSTRWRRRCVSISNRAELSWLLLASEFTPKQLRDADHPRESGWVQSALAGRSSILFVPSARMGMGCPGELTFPRCLALWAGCVECSLCTSLARKLMAAEVAKGKVEQLGGPPPT